MRAWTKNSFFAGLTPEELCRVERLLNHRMFRGRQVIISAGTQQNLVYFLLSGSVSIRTLETGRNGNMLHILWPGEILGELRAVDNKPHSATVTAREEVCCATLEIEAFRHLRRNVPQLNFNLNEILAERLRRLTEHTQAVTQPHLRGRVTRQLAVTACQHQALWKQAICAPSPPEPVEIPLHLTQSELADLVSAARVRVNAVLQEMQGEGILRLSLKQITILDVAALYRSRGAKAND